MPGCYDHIISMQRGASISINTDQSMVSASRKPPFFSGNNDVKGSFFTALYRVGISCCSTKHPLFRHIIVCLYWVLLKFLLIVLPYLAAHLLYVLRAFLSAIYQQGATVSSAKPQLCVKNLAFLTSTQQSSLKGRGMSMVACWWLKGPFVSRFKDRSTPLCAHVVNRSIPDKLKNFN